MPVNENIKSLPFINILTKIRSNTIFQVLSFAFLTAIAAQISIPVKPVPFTLQTMMVVLAGAFLGAQKGAYSQVVYLIMGVIGLPVFAQTADMSFGIARLFGPTGGYLLGFPIAAFLTGLLVQKYKNYFAVTAAMFAGNILILITGTLYLNVFFITDFNQAFASGVVIFLLWTVVKVMASSSIYFGFKKRNFKAL